jgi:hypothetical protein
VAVSWIHADATSICTALQIELHLRRDGDKFLLDTSALKTLGVEYQVSTDMPPSRFRFDDGPTWEGYSHGWTWNSFDNVAVTRETLDRIVAWSMENALDAGDAYQQFEQFVDLEPMPCGLYSLGWGFATVIVEELERT